MLFFDVIYEAEYILASVIGGNKKPRAVLFYGVEAALKSLKLSSLNVVFDIIHLFVGYRIYCNERNGVTLRLIRNGRGNRGISVCGAVEFPLRVFAPSTRIYWNYFILKIVFENVSRKLLKITFIRLNSINMLNFAK